MSGLPHKFQIYGGETIRNFTGGTCNFTENKTSIKAFGPDKST